jgi:hypothetical protein
MKWMRVADLHRFGQSYQDCASLVKAYTPQIGAA